MWIKINILVRSFNLCQTCANLIQGTLHESRLPDSSADSSDAKIFDKFCRGVGCVFVAIGVVLKQYGKHVSFFTEKLSDAKCGYSTYDLEFYAQDIHHWQYCMLYVDFNGYLYHTTPSYLNSLRSSVQSILTRIILFSYFLSYSHSHSSINLGRVTKSMYAQVIIFEEF